MTFDSDHPPAPNPQQAGASGSRISVAKKLLFAIVVTVAFFGLLEAVLALFGVTPRAYEEDPYVGFSGRSPLFVEVTEPDGSVVMETSPARASLFNAQRFPRAKAPGTTRIFCVGGSTTYGRPYDDRTSFCGWLRELLAVASPERRWEVVNAGGISYASYRVALVMEELARYQPDLFVVYSGHNEFLERRTYPQIISTPRALRGLGALASRTRTWTALSSALETVRGKPERSEAKADVLGDEVVTLLDEAVGPEAYTRDDRLREQVLRHYRFNLARMVEIARSAGAETLMITPASNLRHATPFKSEHGPSFPAEQEDRWEAFIGTGISLYRKGELATAAERFQAAVDLDPRYAGAQFLLGQVLYVQERFDEARRAFERARDEDVCPLRALGPMAGMVRDVARDRGTLLVDFERLVDERSEHGIPGNSSFLDHVHPTIEVNRELALAIIDRLVEAGMVVPVAGWGPAAVEKVAARVEGGLDRRDHAMALTNLAKVLGWAGKQQESYQLTLRAVELDPNDVQVQYHAGLTADLLGRHDEAMEHYRRAIEIMPTADLPHGNLAVGLEREGRLDEAIEHYRLALQYSSPEMLEHHRENLASALVVQGIESYRQRRFDDAVSQLEEADTIRPGDAETLARLGVALAAAGRADEAAERLGAAVRQRPDDAYIRSRQAVALALAGRLDEAAEARRRAIELDAGIAGSANDPADSLDRLGRPELANALRSGAGSE